MQKKVNINERAELEKHLLSTHDYLTSSEDKHAPIWEEVWGMLNLNVSTCADEASVRAT